MTGMTLQELDYVRRAIARHVDFHFHEIAAKSYREAEIHWTEWHDPRRWEGPRQPSIIIPVVPRKMVRRVTWSVAFRDTSIVLWNRLPLPEGWQCDDDLAPLWYHGPQGQVMPAWDLAGTVFDLLTMNEETWSPQRDSMGRSVASMSPRNADGRLLVPMINNSAALLVDQCLHRFHAEAATPVPFVKPLSVSLSHDLDQLRGDDFWTQAARLWRFASPLRRLRPPHFPALASIVGNMLSPRRYFMDDLLGMVAAEKAHGFRSINYVLCGARGRYGARTSSRHIRPYLREVIPHCDTGIHYNHDTLEQSDNFDRQHQEVEAMVSRAVVAGRAHYLRMDSRTSFHFWEARGIRIDESLGYPDAVGYRAGIAGPFKPFDRASGREASITSLPLVAMDSAIACQFGSDYANAIEKMVRHLAIVGGTFSLLFHPGMFANPEHPETEGMYECILGILAAHGAVSKTPSDILADMETGGEELCY